MTPFPCNHCGQCCRQGAHDCTLRHREWSGLDIPHGFSGACDLLTEDSQCSTMLSLLSRDGPDALRRFGIDGMCDFLHLRRVPLPMAR